MNSYFSHSYSHSRFFFSFILLPVMMPILITQPSAGQLASDAPSPVKLNCLVSSDIRSENLIRTISYSTLVYSTNRPSYCVWISLLAVFALGIRTEDGGCLRVVSLDTSSLWPAAVFHYIYFIYIAVCNIVVRTTLHTHHTAYAPKSPARYTPFTPSTTAGVPCRSGAAKGKSENNERENFSPNHVTHISDL